MVAEYCDISLFEVLELEVFEFYYLLRDSVVYNYSQTEEGRKYLNNAWRLEQTEGDIEALRNTFGKGAKYGE